MGALFVSSTSVFVSCKDYDDDINNVSTRVTTLEAAKVELENKITALRAEMADVYATKAALKDTAYAERVRAMAAEAALSTRITTAQDGVDALNALIGGNLNDYEDFKGLTYKQALTKTWAKLETVETNLGNRLTKLETDLSLTNPESALRVYLKNLEDQITALNNFKAALDADGGAATKNWVGLQIAAAEQRAADDATAKANAAKDAAIAAAAADATTKANAAKDAAIAAAAADATTKANQALADAKVYADGKLVEAKTYADQKLTEAKNYADQKLTEAKTYTDDQITALNIPQLRQDLADLSVKVDNIEANLNLLTMIEKQLRSLVFVPQVYVDGVEGLLIRTLQYHRFNNFTTANWTSFFDGTDTNKNKFDANRGWNIKEAKYNETTFDMTLNGKDRNADHDRYNRETEGGNVKIFTRTLDFTAEYHLNPSTADLSNITKNNIAVLSGDKDWYTRNAACGFFIRDIVKPGEEGGKAGILQVKYAVTDPTRIKTTADNQITVFATQLNYADTTITSDYATLKNQYCKNLVLAINPVAGALKKDNNGRAIVRNHHCGECKVFESGVQRDSLHLFATIREAAGSGADDKADDAFAPQFQVAYNNATGIDLESLIETHFDDIDNAHHVFTDAAKYGLSYEFELTYLKYGNNLTSESAHAVIVNKDGKPYLIPWLPTNTEREGVQSAYDETKTSTYQTKQLVGRTPLVRVSLIDEEKNIIDYGYIRFEIVDNDVEPGVPENPWRRFISYTGPAWSVDIPWTYGQCDNTWPGGPWSYTTTWIEQELDIYALAGVSKATFDQNWKAEYKAGGAALKQYLIGDINPDDSKLAKFSAAAADRGTISELPNPNPQESDVLKWNITTSEAKTMFYDASPRPSTMSVAMRYIYDPDNNGISDDVTKDIYVVFNTGALTVNVAGAITGTVDWTGRKNPNYWYTLDKSTSGFNEIHANVYGVEDEKEVQAYTLKQTIQATFMNNVIVNLSNLADKKAFLNLVNASDAIYNGIALSLKFVEGPRKLFKGVYDGELHQFGTFVSTDGMMLRAWLDEDEDGVQDATEPVENVAQLVYTDPGDQTINKMDVQYLHTDFAEALLNLRAHDALNADVLTAYVSVFAKYSTCDIPLDCEPIIVRFLRPINVENKNAEVQDAATTEKQIVYLRDLVELSDWRTPESVWKTNYWYYYNITAIEPLGVSDGEKLSVYDGVMTNLGYDNVDAALDKKLQDVSTLVEFKYFAPAVTPVALTPAAIPAQDAYGRIEYTNLGSTVHTFKVRIPVRVEYEWGRDKGAIYTFVDINVVKTAGNARQK